MYVCTVYSVLTPWFHISAHAKNVSAYNLLKIVHACNTDFTAANNLALLTFSQCLFLKVKNFLSSVEV